MWRATRGTNSRQTETANTKTLGHAGSENPPVLGQLGMGGREADETRPDHWDPTGAGWKQSIADSSRSPGEGQSGQEQVTGANAEPA